MKQLRVAAFLLVVFLIVLLSPSSSGQSSQAPPGPQTSPSPASVPVGAETTNTSQIPAPSLDGASRPWRKIKVTPPRSHPTAPKLLRDAPLLPGVLGQRVADSAQEAPSQQGIEPRILLQRALPYQSLDGGMFVKGPSGSSQPGTREPLFDRGIFVKRRSGNGVCGSIVSYNFSPGDNPQLESVTTCTPADAIETRRARGKNNKPSGPVFQTTEYTTPRP